MGKRMRARKESMPEIDLPLAFKNGYDNLSLWTMQNQVKADQVMIKKALHRVDCKPPIHAMKIAKWKKKQRRVAEIDMGMIKRRNAPPNSKERLRMAATAEMGKLKWAAAGGGFQATPENDAGEKTEYRMGYQGGGCTPTIATSSQHAAFSPQGKLNDAAVDVDLQSIEEDAMTDLQSIEEDARTLQARPMSSLSTRQQNRGPQRPSSSLGRRPIERT